MALVEARRAHVRPFCITVDPHGADYLEKMYGRGNYLVVEHVESLPERMSALYHRLTR
jgi:nitric oxide reductase NorD protein